MLNEYMSACFCVLVPNAQALLFPLSFNLTFECVCLDLSPEGKAVYLWSLTSYPPRTAGLPPYIPCPTCKKPSLVPFVREMSVDHIVVLWLLWSFHTSSTLDVFCVDWIFDIGHLLTLYFRVRLWSAGVKLHLHWKKISQSLSLCLLLLVCISISMCYHT